MTSALILLLVTTAFSVVMLFVLSSLKASQVAGVREWGWANALAVLGLLLFAGRGVLPDVLSIEAANGVYLVTISLMYGGFRRHLGRALPVKTLAAGSALTLAAVAGCHYLVDSFALRVVAVSIYHSAVCFALGASVPATVDARLRYPSLFTKVAALALGGGHALRGAVYAIEAAAPLSFPGLATYNLVFLAIGTLALPLLTMGAVMMANARILGAAAHVADHDHLTGAASRRAFFAAAADEIARARRSGAPLGLLLFDVDHFKRINDAHGHGVGDRVLCEIVARTRETMRGIDRCGRLGGEEFGVLLPGADAHRALAAAERLRTTLDGALARAAPDLPVRYTVSIGLAMLEPDESFESLLARADAALYQAKAAGRNRVVAAGAPHEALLAGAGAA